MHPRRRLSVVLWLSEVGGAESLFGLLEVC